MTAAGLAKLGDLKIAERRALPIERSTYTMPTELEEALARNETARHNFENFASSYQRQFIGWIASAKKHETRLRRVDEAISLLNSNEKLGMK